MRRILKALLSIYKCKSEIYVTALVTKRIERALAKLRLHFVVAAVLVALWKQLPGFSSEFSSHCTVRRMMDVLPLLLPASTSMSTVAATLAAFADSKSCRLSFYGFG